MRCVHPLHAITHPSPSSVRPAPRPNYSEGHLNTLAFRRLSIVHARHPLQLSRPEPPLAFTTDHHGMGDVGDVPARVRHQRMPQDGRIVAAHLAAPPHEVAP